MARFPPRTSHYPDPEPIDPAFNEPQFAPSQFPIFRVPVSTPLATAARGYTALVTSSENARNNPCPLESLTEGAALESTGQLEFKSISTEPGYPIAFGLGILAASAVTSVYFNPAPVLKSTTRSSALR